MPLESCEQQDAELAYYGVNPTYSSEQSFLAISMRNKQSYKARYKEKQHQAIKGQPKKNIETQA